MLETTTCAVILIGCLRWQFFHWICTRNTGVSSL